MIRGLHGLFYSSDANATRAFMRDALRLPFTDVGGGWLIFDLPEGDVGVHPIEGREPEPNTHDVSFYCDDIKGTVAELRARGVQFKADPADHGYGYVTYFTMPGGIEVQLYEPKYAKRAGKAPSNGVKAKPVAAPAKAKAKPVAKAKAKPVAKPVAKKTQKPAKKKRR